jgi:hypothetical protein
MQDPLWLGLGDLSRLGALAEKDFRGGGTADSSLEHGKFFQIMVSYLIVFLVEILENLQKSKSYLMCNAHSSTNKEREIGIMNRSSETERTNMATPRKHHKLTAMSSRGSFSQLIFCSCKDEVHHGVNGNQLALKEATRVSQDGLTVVLQSQNAR